MGRRQEFDLLYELSHLLLGLDRQPRATVRESAVGESVNYLMCFLSSTKILTVSLRFSTASQLIA